MNAYDATEFVIGMAAKSALDRAFGGAAPVVTGYHRFHFQLLARALQESNRDQDIQKSLEALRKNLDELKAYGKRLVEKIPARPEPPSADVAEVLDPAKNKVYARRVAEFTQGVANLLELLGAYVKSAEDVHKRTKDELAKIEKGLDMHASRWDAMRKISNARRLEEIQFLRLREMDALAKQIGAVKGLRSAYENF